MENQPIGPSDPSAQPLANAIAVGPPVDERRRGEVTPPPQVIIHQGGAGFSCSSRRRLGLAGLFFLRIDASGPIRGSRRIL